MYQTEKFNFVDGVVDEEQIGIWVESFFSNLSNIFNSFFCQLDAREAFSRISIIPFEKLLLEQLEDESEEVIEIAVAKLKELVENELEILKSYLGNL